MTKQAQHKEVLMVIALILLGMSLAACQGVTENQSFPVVDDPDLEINVTPLPDPGKTRTVHFTVKIVRVGSHMKVGWWAKGEAYIAVTLNNSDELVDLDALPLATGNGFGMAGYDGSGGPCINLGGWPVDYSVQGEFNPESCELSIAVTESWPKTEAHAVCLGSGAEVEGPPYSMIMPGIKFSETHVVDATTTEDEIVWVNTFTLVPGKGTETLDCMYVDPPTPVPEN
ncbi:MAG: hypothetical protein ACK2T7_12780 [Anaerolineales bacterium]